MEVILKHVCFVTFLSYVFYFHLFSRAMTRLQNEDVFGAKIKIKLKTKQSKQTSHVCSKTKENQAITKDPAKYFKEHQIKPDLMNYLPNPLPNDNKLIQQQFPSHFIPSQAFNPLPSSLMNISGFPPMGLPLPPPPPELFQQFMNSYNNLGGTVVNVSANNKHIEATSPSKNEMLLSQMYANLPGALKVPVPKENKSNEIISKSTKTNNQSNGTDIIVESLDESINYKEFKKLIISLFQDHCKIISVSVIGQNKKDKKFLQAFVKVTKLIDALWCISNLADQMNDKKVMLSFDKDDSMIKLKTEVFNLLYNHPGKWMPLNEFLSKYKEKYSKAIHAPNLDKAKELIYIDGKPGLQFICLLQNPIGTERIRPVPHLSKTIVDILKHHNRRIPLAW